ncbi:MAG: DUF4129 domain-containing protein [Bacteroidota bacterium]
MRKFGLLIPLLIVPFWILSQRDSIAVKFDDQEIGLVEITEADLAPFKADDKFNYQIEKTDNSWWEGVKNWFYNILRRFFEWLFGVDAAPSYIAAFLRYIPYVLLGLLLFLLIRFFIKANTKNILFAKNNEGMVLLSEEERLMKTEDIQGLIKQALDNRNYRLAIRYYYLYLLQLLSERELINWELQKTNEDYIQELSQSKLRPLFQKVTLLYDHIWYGEFVIDSEGYDKAKINFDQLRNSIATDV